MLTVIPASEVRDGEPRWWATSYRSACEAIANDDAAVEYLHTDTSDEWEIGLPLTFAIVDRPEEPSAPPTSDAERRFWESSCTAALSSLTAKVGDLFSSGAEFRECATRAADIADAATVEWRKRWGAK